MRDSKGRFVKGYRYSTATEFKQGEHWRPRKPYWSREWLLEEYGAKARSAQDIAAEFGITENAILFWLGKHGIPCRSMAEVRSIKHWGATGEANSMFGRRGQLHPNWEGGNTPYRQRMCGRLEWRRFADRIRQRDKACRLCGGTETLHIHHIDPLRRSPLLIMDEGNVILLCKSCHLKVKGKENKWKQKFYKLIQGA